MARDTKIITDTWQQIASTFCVITITKEAKQGNGQLYFNDVAQDANSLKIPVGKLNSEVIQNEDKPVFCKHTSPDDNWEVVVDELE